MTKKVEHIAPPTSSDANSASYPVKRAPNGIGRYVEISTDMAICDYWMNILGTALAEKRKIKADGKIRLKALPPRYKMFEHRRHGKSDIYIYGHPSKQRFRSALQFRRHLLWLDQKTVKPACKCKLCELAPAATKEEIVEEKLEEKIKGKREREAKEDIAESVKGSVKGKGRGGKGNVNENVKEKAKESNLQPEKSSRGERREDRRTRVFSPAVRSAIRTGRSGSPISSPKSTEGSQERRTPPRDMINDMITPHKLGLSNPRPLKMRNKRQKL